jgi:hypothetical protein
LQKTNLLSVSCLEFGHDIGIAAGFLRQHFIQDFFHCHGMSTDFPGGEKGTGTLQFAIFQAGGVDRVISPKFYIKVGEGNSIGFLGITLGFFNLPNNTGLHFLPPHNN